MAHSPKFLEATIDLAVLESLNVPRKSPAVSSAAVTFRANIDRVYAMYRLVLDVCRHSASYCMAGAAFGIARQGTVEEFVAWLAEPVNKENVRKALEIVGKNPIWDYREAKGHFALAIEPYIEASGQEAVMASMLINAWTAFEVLAQDLWIGVLNEHPSILAGLSGKGDSKKEIPLWLLQRHNFDMSSVMGDFLKEKFNFTVLLDTRKAYVSAFREDATNVITAITDKSLDAVSLLRNLLVHKAGVIDQIFLDESRDIPSLAAIVSLGRGSVVKFDGHAIRGLIEPVIKTAVSLIQSVDDWLSSNPATS